MKDIEFVKAVASGNDFIIINNSRNRKAEIAGQIVKLAKELCRRKFSAGADGLLLLEPSKKANFKMRIFNPDGSEVDMCGNGSRCAALYARQNKIVSAGQMTIETGAGNIEAEVKEDKVKIKLSRPHGLRLKFNLDINGQAQEVSYINTGVPHVVCFVQGLDGLDVEQTGKAIRYHPEFQPAGTNANFVEVLDKGHIKIRTYERGVEQETLACGSGSVAASIITCYQMQKKESLGKHKMKVDTQGGETLAVYFNSDKDKIDRVYLEGKAKIVYQGILSNWRKGDKDV